MRTAIYGAGSLGTILGAYLTEGGVQVDLINRNKAHVDALKSNGATVTGTVHKNIPVSALTPDEMTGTYDLIFLMTKQLFNTDVVTFLKPYLSPDGVICTLQNGIPEPSIAEIIGESRVCGGTVAWGATLTAPGVSELTSDPDSLSFGMGDMGAFDRKKLLEIKEVLEHMCPVELEDNFMGVRWSKLLINAVFSGMGTAIGGTFGDVTDNKKARLCAQYAMQECIDAAHASGIKFATVQGKDIVKLMGFSGEFKRKISFLLIPIAMKKHHDIRPSMLQDIEHGKKCEVDAINGVVCDFGRKHGVPTPFNDKIVEIITAGQDGKLKLNISNLSMFDELLASVK